MAISIIFESAGGLMNSALVPGRSSACSRARRGRVCARAGTGMRRLGQANASENP